MRPGAQPLVACHTYLLLHCRLDWQDSLSTHMQHQLIVGRIPAAAVTAAEGSGIRTNACRGLRTLVPLLPAVTMVTGAWLRVDRLPTPLCSQGTCLPLGGTSIPHLLRIRLRTAYSITTTITNCNDDHQQGEKVL